VYVPCGLNVRCCWHDEGNFSLCTACEEYYSLHFFVVEKEIEVPTKQNHHNESVTTKHPPNVLNQI
jgi:hypothetical protein